MEWLELVFVLVLVINMLTNMESYSHVKAHPTAVKKMLSNNGDFAVGNYNALQKLDAHIANNSSYEKGNDFNLNGVSEFASCRKRRKEKREIGNKTRTISFIKSRKAEKRQAQYINSKNNSRSDDLLLSIKQTTNYSHNSLHSLNTNCSLKRICAGSKRLKNKFKYKNAINFQKYKFNCEKLNSCGFLRPQYRKFISDSYLNTYKRAKRNALRLNTTSTPENLNYIKGDLKVHSGLEQNDCQANASCHQNVITEKQIISGNNLIETQSDLSLSIANILKKLSPLLIELNKTLSRDMSQTTEKYQIHSVTTITSTNENTRVKTLIIPNSLGISPQSIPVTQSSTVIRSLGRDYSKKVTESSNVANREKIQDTTPVGDHLFPKSIIPETSSTHPNVFSENDTNLSQTTKRSEKKHVQSLDFTTKPSINRKLSPVVSYKSLETFDQIDDIISMPGLFSTLLPGLNYTHEQVNKSYLIEQFKRMYPVKLWETGGQFSEHFLRNINSHWLQFPPPPPENHYILAVLYCIIMVIGMIGNALVVLMFIRCRSLQTPANILVMNLAVSDFLLLSKMPVFIYNSLYQGPVLGEIGCQIYGFMGGLTGTVSIMTLAAISLDRYYVIVYPLDPIRKTTRCRARLSVLFVWCYGCLFSIIPLLGVGIGKYVPEGYLTSCSFDYLDFSFNNRLFIFIFFLAAWFLPFCVIMVCYVGICRVVIVTRNVKNAIGEDSSRHEKNRSELRLAGVVIGIIGLWFAAWTPYAVVALLGIAGQQDLLTPLSSMIPALFCKTASCIDPYVYAVTHPRFRLEVTSFVRNLSSKRKMKADMKRASRAWTTEIEMSEPVHHIKRSHSSDDNSDVEEVIVAVGTGTRESVSSDEVTIQEVPANDHEDLSPGAESCTHNFVFPIPESEKQKLRPPTWFVAPKPQYDKNTSFKYKLNENKT